MADREHELLASLVKLVIRMETEFNFPPRFYTTDEWNDLSEAIVRTRDIRKAEFNVGNPR